MDFKGIFTKTALLVTSASVLFANDPGLTEYQNYASEPYAQDSFCQDVCCPTSCSKFVVAGEFLYLRAAQNGLDYCFNDGFNTETVGGVVVTNIFSDLKEPNFEWSPGFRVGAGWENSNGYALGATWTHLYSKAHSHQGVNNLHWNLHFDVIDLVLGGNLYENCDLSLGVIFGLRGAKIESKTRSFRVNDFLSYIKADNNKQEFTGLGPILGLGLNYKLGCSGFGLYADGAISALYGRYHNHLNSTLLLDGEVRNLFVHQRTSAYQGVFDAGLGIRWDKEFCNDKRVFIKLGVELHRYFSYNRLGDHDDLCLDGGNVTLGFEY